MRGFTEIYLAKVFSVQKKHKSRNLLKIKQQLRLFILKNSRHFWSQVAFSPPSPRLPPPLKLWRINFQSSFARSVSLRLFLPRQKKSTDSNPNGLPSQKKLADGKSSQPGFGSLRPPSPRHPSQSLRSFFAMQKKIYGQQDWLAIRSFSEGWWSRRELNPRPVMTSWRCLHAYSATQRFIVSPLGWRTGGFATAPAEISCADRRIGSLHQNADDVPHSLAFVKRGTWLNLGSQCVLFVRSYCFDRCFTGPTIIPGMQSTFSASSRNRSDPNVIFQVIQHCFEKNQMYVVKLKARRSERQAYSVLQNDAISENMS